MEESIWRLQSRKKVLPFLACGNNNFVKVSKFATPQDQSYGKGNSIHGDYRRKDIEQNILYPKQEFENLRSQIATSSWGGRRVPPYAFTEHGVLMLSRKKSERE
jgi:ORF6N domain